jgi:hypothetical protein
LYASIFFFTSYKRHETALNSGFIVLSTFFHNGGKIPESSSGKEVDKRIEKHRGREFTVM